MHTERALTIVEKNEDHRKRIKEKIHLQHVLILINSFALKENAVKLTWEPP